MSKGKWAFRPTDLKRAIKASSNTGLEIARAEIEPATGKIVIVFGKSVRPPEFVHGFIDRYGKPRFYFRRPGFKQVALPGLPCHRNSWLLTGVSGATGADRKRTNQTRHDAISGGELLQLAGIPLDEADHAIGLPNIIDRFCQECDTRGTPHGDLSAAFGDKAPICD